MGVPYEKEKSETVTFRIQMKLDRKTHTKYQNNKKAKRKIEQKTCKRMGEVLTRENIEEQ